MWHTGVNRVYRGGHRGDWLWVAGYRLGSVARSAGELKIAQLYIARL